MLRVHVAYKGQTHPVTISETDDLSVLSKQIAEATGVSEKYQKLVSKGRALPKTGSAKEAQIGDGMKLLLVGTSESEVEAVVNAKADPTIRGFDARRRHPYAAKPTTSAQKQSPYRFERIQVLTQFSTPPASEAEAILKRLSKDPGIVGIMNEHRWTIGLLKEMPPDGKVGVDPVCVLGYNENKGQAIALRLRTDDLKGFRKYDSIRKVLLHELAHMVFSEHNSDFHQLNRQLNQECEQFDWSKSGRSVGGESMYQRPQSSSMVDDDEETELMRETRQSSGQRLGGNTDLQRLFGARQLAGTAAIMRLTQEEMEITDGCSSAARSHDHSTDHRTSSTVTDPTTTQNADSGADSKLDSHSDVAGDETNGTVSNDQFNIYQLNLERSLSETSASSAPMQIDSVPSSDSSSFSSPSLLDSVSIDTPNLSFNNSLQPQTMQPMDISVSPPLADSSLPPVSSSSSSSLPSSTHSVSTNDVVTVSDVWQCPQCTLENPVNASRCSLCDNPRPVSAEDQLMQDLSASTDTIQLKLKSALDKIRSSCTTEKKLETLHALHVYVTNALQSADAKFRRIRMANPAFQAKVAQVDGALDVLKAVGFVQTETDGMLSLQRNDPGLLWLCKSILEDEMSSDAN
eukprot:GILJ01006519.1.p1 GENE.GILJ01006519.1~~GILJ01006519.1.p1  ORF type:complete len:630 (-),score=93.08 GILJ01006519.1:137-2026(-)